MAPMAPTYKFTTVKPTGWAYPPLSSQGSGVQPAYGVTYHVTTSTSNNTVYIIDELNTWAQVYKNEQEKKLDESKALQKLKKKMAKEELEKELSDTAHDLVIKPIKSSEKALKHAAAEIKQKYKHL